jgi:hypothetical protein
MTSRRHDVSSLAVTLPVTLAVTDLSQEAVTAFVTGR